MILTKAACDFTFNL